MQNQTYITTSVVLLLLLIIGSLYYLGTRSVTAPGIGKPAREMSFFITSANPGSGGDLGGLEGADNYCRALAASAGAGDRTWRAYVSAQAAAGSLAINARDRIGAGPWRNFRGEVIANDLDELHGAGNTINKQTALTEKGEAVNGRGDSPNWHDILTGSGPDGRALATTTDATCGNWARSSGGSAMVGHHDRLGLRDDEASRSWNSSHFTRGCSLDELATTGSGGLMYCFAAN